MSGSHLKQLLRQSDKGSDNIVYPVDWTSTGRACQPFAFTADLGVKFEVADKSSPPEFFEKFFDDQVIELIAIETNRFAKQTIEAAGVESLPKKARLREWHDTSAEETKLYVALLILQGVDSKSENRFYFGKRESVRNSLFPKVMSGCRFEMISKFLHFVDNTSYACCANAPERKLAKIQSLIDVLLPKFRNNYIPTKNISIDESLLGWKGRLSYVQYFPSKRKRFGIKFFDLCESATGYIWNFVVYTGGDTRYNEQYRELPITAQIVCKRCNPLFGKGYCLYTDNFFMSPSLADILVSKQTDFVGTLRLNRRNVPQKVKEAKLKKTEIVVAFKNKTMVLKWKDKRDVTVLSTIHDNSMVKTVSRRGLETEKPKVIVDYNANMGGVDLSDDCCVTIRQQDLE